MASGAVRVLLVDDDPGVLHGLRRALVLEGYVVFTAEDGNAALSQMDNDAPDLVVLDVVLPGIDGLEVCRRIRASSDVPILLLTARDTVPDRVFGLDGGADDYLVKPFALEELLARIRVLLRRSQHSLESALAFADVRLDFSTHEVSRAGQPLLLTAHQFTLLAVFLRHPRQALYRDQLCALAWGHDFQGESNFVDVSVMELRRKLEAGGKTRLIQTVRGVGYALRDG